MLDLRGNLDYLGRGHTSEFVTSLLSKPMKCKNSILFKTFKEACPKCLCYITEPGIGETKVWRATEGLLRASNKYNSAASLPIPTANVLNKCSFFWIKIVWTR